MKKILAITSTRADYGILSNILKKINDSKKLNLLLVVTGTHLCEEYGLTINEIERDQLPVAVKIPIIIPNSSKTRVPKEMAELSVRLSQIIADKKPDFMLILGDRYEMLSAASTALVMHLPIIHISGGETTEGAIDNQIRNAISQMAEYHFPGAVEYAEKLISMGAEPSKVFNVGDPALENIKNLEYLSRARLETELEIKINKNSLLVTYHSVTQELESLESQINSLVSALISHNGNKIITYPNSDEGSDIIIKALKEYSSKYSKVKLVKNLGKQRYLSLMKYCGAVVGNSSSGIIEAPFMKKPVVNIGNRQKGRLMSKNIISCGYSQKEIESAIAQSLSPEFQKIAENCKSLYGEGNTSKEIVSVLESL